MARSKLTPMRWFVILLLIVCILSLVLASDPRIFNTFHISRGAHRLIVLFLLLPLAALWYASFFAYAKLQEYTRYLKSSKEGKAFRKITSGLGTLAFGLIIIYIISLVLYYAAAHKSGLQATAIIINNYLSLLVPVLAFTLINSGSHMLVELVNERASLLGIRVFAIMFTILGVFYTHITLQTHNLIINPYHLSVYPLMITLVIPYLYAWFVGLVSAYNFKIYSEHVKGLLYKKSLSQFAAGITITIVGSIAVQFVISTVGAKTNEPLGLVLAVIYLLMAILLGGLGLMAVSTQKLKKIEEV